MSEYHIPVMLQECLDGLNIHKGGIYVDATFGGGGHSRAILERLEDGKLFGFDQDTDAIANIPADKKFVFVNHNFRYMKNFMRYHKAIPADGILADLGISSHQIDVPERGFAHRFDAELDMRMDTSSHPDAKEVINTYSEFDLKTMFRLYGEVENAGRLVGAIVSARTKHPIETVAQLKEAIKNVIPRHQENKYLSQVFQALRIEVNRELEALKRMLVQSADILKPGGRLVIMSYHSLEDRLVKNFMNSGNFEGELEKDLYGNVIRPFKPLNKKAILATNEEIEINSRARSAKLRIAEKL